MKPLYKINEYKHMNFTFLPDIKIEKYDEYLLYFHKKSKLMQGNIGDCYLISSIISIANNFPLILDFIFPKARKLNYNEKTKEIEMIVYKNGFKENISFNNTYATYNGQLLFSKPFNNELYGIAMEKGYAISNCTDGKLSSGYNEIIGGSGYKAFEILLGAASEKFISNKFEKKLYGYKYINKNNLKNKIKKYIDYGGLITFGVYYNDKEGHEYSLQGYKIGENGEFLIEIINPHRSGNYLEENICLNKDRFKLNKINNEYPIIFETDFKNKESKDSLYSYWILNFGIR